MIWKGNITKVQPNGTNNHSLWCSPLHDEAANHHVVTCLHQAARADVAQIRRRAYVRFYLGIEVGKLAVIVVRIIARRQRSAAQDAHKLAIRIPKPRSTGSRLG